MDRTEHVLTVWVVYENPADYPGKFVVRPQWVRRDNSIEIAPAPTCVVDSLDEARSHVPPGLYWMPRAQEDELGILETWI